MFKLFKKKEEPKPQPQVTEEKSAAYKALTADFDPVEETVLVLTSPASFSAKQNPDTGLWEGGILLSAWLVEGEDEIHREPTALVSMADERLMSVLRQRMPSNFILKLKARMSLDGKRLLVTDLPAPGFDPDLKALLEEQKKPVTQEIEGLGTFTLSRSMGWFETDVDWMDQSVLITFDQDGDQETSLAVLRALLADPAGWDQRLRSFAADQLLETANQCAEEDEISREDFVAAIQPESIHAGENDSFLFVFNDGDLLWGNAIQVSGTVSQGPVSAQSDVSAMLEQ